MNQNKVNQLLLVTIAVMAILPLITSLYFVDAALQTSLNLGFNQQIIGVLDANASNLKLLGQLDSAHQQQYREQFENNENLRTIYSSPDFIRKSLRHSLLIYFSLGLAVALLVSVVTASVLTQRIASSFSNTFDRLNAQHEKIRYLEEISSWQELAKILAHEIKNPLTPIKILATSMVKSYQELPPERFAEQLLNTQRVILEELGHLNEIVNKFSTFSKLPSIQMIESKLHTVLTQHIYAINATFHSACVVLADADEHTDEYVMLDRTLFRQVLTNIIRNGLEANAERLINFTVKLRHDQDAINVSIENDGMLVSNEMVPRMFDPYVTSKTKKDNLGLGLAIVRKILLEHGGDIHYEEQQGHPVFVITLPLLSQA